MPYSKITGEKTGLKIVHDRLQERDAADNDAEISADNRGGGDVKSSNG